MGGKMEVQDLLEYVNSELANGSNLTKFAKGLGKNESTIRKKLPEAALKSFSNDSLFLFTFSPFKLLLGHMP